MKNLLKLIGLIAFVAIIGFSMTTCDTGGDDDDGGYWLITNEYPATYAIIDGTPEEVWPPPRGTSYYWHTYRYTDKTNYEEEYTNHYFNDFNHSEVFLVMTSYHYTRNGQTSHSTTKNTFGIMNGSSTTETIETTATYDLSSGLTSSFTTISSTGVTTTNYAIELIGDTGEVKNYKYYPFGSTWYSIYKIQNDRTLEVSYYNDSGLQYTTTYIWPDIAEIREKLPNFTIYSTNYSSSYSIRSSHQTVEVLPDLPGEDWGDIPHFRIRVKTFNDGVLSSHIDYTYEKISFRRDNNSDGSITEYAPPVQEGE